MCRIGNNRPGVPAVAAWMSFVETSPLTAVSSFVKLLSSAVSGKSLMLPMVIVTVAGEQSPSMSQSS